MAIYTKKGDSGNTYLIGNKKVSKSDPIFEVLGTFDELNSLIGVLIASANFTKSATDILISIQKNLFRIGALIADPKSEQVDYIWIDKKTLELEYLINDLEGKLPKLTNFILPGGEKSASIAHQTRAVCRRLERRLVTYVLISNFVGGKYCVKYVNRLSDLLFCLARYLNYTNNKSDIIWAE